MKRLFLSGGGCLLVAALFCALLTPCAATAQPDVMTPELYAQLRAVHDVAISPDGNLIAYTLVVPRNPFVEEDGKAHYHLYTVDRNGQSRAWVTGEVRATDPAFTPDGRYISYLAERDEDDHDALYVIPVAGGESRKVIEFATEIKAYAWAPNSREVAFLAKDSLPDEIEKLEDMGFDQEIYEEDWQPVRIWVLDTDDSAGAPRRLEIDGSARELHWSPEGAYLATTIAPTPLVDDRYMFRKVTIVDPYTGTVVRQYDTEGKLGDLAFSPDGQHLAFVAGVDINDPKEGELWLVTVDSDEITKLVTDFDGHVARVGWKDNETVMFLADVHVHTGLGRVKTDGSDMTMKRFDDGPVFRYLKIAADGNTMVLRGSDYN
ncbi:hypothetical protein GF420_07625, partial [candidate division GN15 bacterium]|nr:hypothetical protein [candidate division GN15 bacterium]